MAHCDPQRRLRDDVPVRRHCRRAGLSGRSVPRPVVVAGGGGPDSGPRHQQSAQRLYRPRSGRGQRQLLPRPLRSPAAGARFAEQTPAAHLHRHHRRRSAGRGCLPHLVPGRPDPVVAGGGGGTGSVLYLAAEAHRSGRDCCAVGVGTVDGGRRLLRDHRRVGLVGGVDQPALCPGAHDGHFRQAHRQAG